MSFNLLNGLSKGDISVQQISQRLLSFKYYFLISAICRKSLLIDNLVANVSISSRVFSFLFEVEFVDVFDHFRKRFKAAQ